MSAKLKKLATLFAGTAAAVAVAAWFLTLHLLRPYDRPEYHEIDTSE